MRKYVWIAVIALIACAVYFTSCERIPKEMMDTIMPDADKVEPPEMPEEMMEMPIDLVDVLIYTNRSYWITLEDVAMAAETTRNLVESGGFSVEITKDPAHVREWMLQTTGDGNMNVIIFYGVLPDSVYGAGNSQPDGSIAENWIETTDGDTILNHADYIAWNSDFEVGEVTGIVRTEDVGVNQEGGLQNLMDNPTISLRDHRNIMSPKTMIVTSDGMALAPSLVDFVSHRSVQLDQLQGEWFAEKIFASDTGDDEAACADPVVLRDGDRGRVAIIHGTFEHTGLLNGEVAAEIIINYLLAPPTMTETVEPPAEPVVEMPPEEMPEMMDFPEGVLHSDEFDGIDLQPFWNVQNGDEGPNMLSGGNLVVEGGFNQNLWEVDSSTRFYQTTNQEQFTVETSMIVDHRDVCSIAGLVIKSATIDDHPDSSGDWVLLKLWGHGAEDEFGNIANLNNQRPISHPGMPNTAFLQFQHRGRGADSSLQQPGGIGVEGYNPPAGNIPIAMRLDRDGDNYVARYKPDAEGEWIHIGETTIGLRGPIQVGLFVGICQIEAPGGLTVSFDYFRVTTPE
ncbi:hypothetical protein C6499_06165 [Candidatus Poribacteria bacterium]|nr:MAG: hypothetical protein C6499_06165 [Candidatus Poribacteria bacterium]